MKRKLSTIILNVSVVALVIFSIILIIMTAQYFDARDRGGMDFAESVMKKVDAAIEKEKIPLGPGKVFLVYPGHIRVEFRIEMPDEPKP